MFTLAIAAQQPQEGWSETRREIVTHVTPKILAAAGFTNYY